MACTYILFSEKTGKFYTGSTHEDDSVIRLYAHNSGKTKSTKFGQPWKLVYEEKYITYTEARSREIFLKTGVGRKWIHENLK
jgi:putative endonuclease